MLNRITSLAAALLMLASPAVAQGLISGSSTSPGLIIPGSGSGTVNAGTAGTLGFYATNGTGTGALDVRNGALNFNGGNVVANFFFVTNNTASATNSVFNINSGTLTTLNGSQIVVPQSNNFVIGATAGQTATWNMLGGTNTVGWAGYIGDVLLGGAAGATGIPRSRSV